MTAQMRQLDELVKGIGPLKLILQGGLDAVKHHETVEELSNDPSADAYDVIFILRQEFDPEHN
jgi:hypothetical protein